MKPEIRPGQIWRHFKGNVYVVLHLAKHSETGEELVVYTKIRGTGSAGDGTVWVRPVSIWKEIVERNGKSQPRFELICDSPRENFCADCHWYEAEEQYCFRNGCHTYNESTCVFWEPVPADEPIPAPGGKTVPTTYDLLYEEGGAGTT